LKTFLEKQVHVASQPTRISDIFHAAIYWLPINGHQTFIYKHSNSTPLMRKHTHRIIYSVDSLNDRYAGKVSTKPSLASLPLPKDLEDSAKLAGGSGPIDANK